MGPSKCGNQGESVGGAAAGSSLEQGSAQRGYCKRSEPHQQLDSRKVAAVGRCSSTPPSTTRHGSQGLALQGSYPSPWAGFFLGGLIRSGVSWRWPAVPPCTGCTSRCAVHETGCCSETLHVGTALSCATCRPHRQTQLLQHGGQ